MRRPNLQWQVDVMHRFIISGGGSGGHVFPALAIAQGIEQKEKNAEILFVGAEGKIEMEKIPMAGFEIIGLPISGLQRSLTWRNVLFPVKVIRSYLKARKVIKDFDPDVVIGVGGYASWPTVDAAARMGIPTLIQEQNSYAGLANRRLASKVDRICVAYGGMEKFFPRDKIVQTGNPVRKNLTTDIRPDEARRSLGLQADKSTVFVFGGSLGAGTLNEAMESAYFALKELEGVQFIWQIGKFYADRFLSGRTAALEHVNASVFIDRMDLAYASADLVICRAGALTISELCFLGKASILVPSPNVAEDHQSRNAEFLVEKGAAEIIMDKEAKDSLIDSALKIIHDNEKLKELGSEARKLSRPDATRDIVNELFGLIHHES